MTTQNNGGPAFPSPEWSDAHGNVSPQEYGMSLRDYFAAKAMQAFIGVAGKGTEFGAGHDDTNSDYAGASYIMADAMIRAREAESGGTE